MSFEEETEEEAIEFYLNHGEGASVKMEVENNNRENEIKSIATATVAPSPPLTISESAKRARELLSSLIAKNNQAASDFVIKNGGNSKKQKRAEGATNFRLLLTEDAEGTRINVPSTGGVCFSVTLKGVVVSIDPVDGVEQDHLTIVHLMQKCESEFEKKYPTIPYPQRAPITIYKKFRPISIKVILSNMVRFRAFQTVYVLAPSYGIYTTTKQTKRKVLDKFSNKEVEVDGLQVGYPMLTIGAAGCTLCNGSELYENVLKTIVAIPQNIEPEVPIFAADAISFEDPDKIPSKYLIPETNVANLPIIPTEFLLKRHFTASQMIFTRLCNWAKSVDPETFRNLDHANGEGPNICTALVAPVFYKEKASTYVYTAKNEDNEDVLKPKISGCSVENSEITAFSTVTNLPTAKRLEDPYIVTFNSLGEKEVLKICGSNDAMIWEKIAIPILNQIDAVFGTTVDLKASKAAHSSLPKQYLDCDPTTIQGRTTITVDHQSTFLRAGLKVSLEFAVRISSAPCQLDLSKQVSVNAIISPLATLNPVYSAVSTGDLYPVIYPLTEFTGDAEATFKNPDGPKYDFIAVPSILAFDGYIADDKNKQMPLQDQVKMIDAIAEQQASFFKMNMIGDFEANEEFIKKNWKVDTKCTDRRKMFCYVFCVQSN